MNAVDTNVLIYTHAQRDPVKQQAAATGLEIINLFAR